MNIIQRLNIFMESTGLSVSQFADKLGVPRPSMSQMLNGRNKKVSNEIIEKLHSVFPTLNVSWLLFGEGDMESSANTQFSSPQITLDFADEAPQTPASQPFVDAAGEIQDIADSAPSTNSAAVSDENPTNSSFNTLSACPPTTNGATTAPTMTNRPAPATPVADQPKTNATAPSAYHDNIGENSKDGIAKEYEAPVPYHKSAPASDSHTTGEEYRVSVLCSSPESANNAKSSDKRISSIMVFYSDSSFEIFKPESDNVAK